MVIGLYNHGNYPAIGGNRPYLNAQRLQSQSVLTKGKTTLIILISRVLLPYASQIYDSSSRC